MKEIFIKQSNNIKAQIPAGLFCCRCHIGKQEDPGRGWDNRCNCPATSFAFNIFKIGLFHFPDFATRESRINSGADLGGGCRGCAPPLPEMTCGFLIQLVFCQKRNYVVYWCWSRAGDECTPSSKKNPGAAPVTAAWRANPKSKIGDNLTILKKKNGNVTFGETG